MANIFWLRRRCSKYLGVLRASAVLIEACNSSSIYPKVLKNYFLGIRSENGSCEQTPPQNSAFWNLGEAREGVNPHLTSPISKSENGGGTIALLTTLFPTGFLDLSLIFIV